MDQRKKPLRHYFDGDGAIVERDSENDRWKETLGERDVEILECVQGVSQFYGTASIGRCNSISGWFDFVGYIKDMKKAAKEMDMIMCQWLEENRQQRASGVLKTEQDFIDVMLSIVDHSDLSGYDADTVIKATCSVTSKILANSVHRIIRFRYSLLYYRVHVKIAIYIACMQTIMAGATDTTSITMTWGLSLLLNHRHVLKKVQDELDEKVGKDRLVNETDMNKLEYLQAVIKETLRLYPAAPLSGSGPREFTEDCTLGGYHIEAGTRLILNIWKLQREEGVWSEASEFKPERLLMGKQKEVDVKGQHFELIPFGAGRRACPGIAFGLQMTHLALAGLLQAFEVTTPSDAAVDMSATFGLTQMKTAPLQVLLTPRLSPSLFH